MESAAAPTPASKKPGFLINRNFALLWSGQSISNVGDFVFSTTLVLWIAAIIAKGQTWAPLAVSGVLLAFARLTSFAPALAVLFLLGIALAPIDIAAGPLILHATPKEFVGRVMAVISPSNALASIASTAIAGVLASTVLQGFHATLLGVSLGPIDTIFTGTGVLVVLGGLYAMVGLRGVTLARTAASEPAAVVVEEVGQPAAEAG